MSLLTLIPTPISDEHKICSKTHEIILDGLSKGAIIAVEEHKVARRRWLSYGLPREVIDNFVIYNEHTYKEASESLLSQLKSGKRVMLMSDCGLPAFCDPGRVLVEYCHQSNIKITSTPFSNSIALALALSGFDHNRFIFEGFIPLDKKDRKNKLEDIFKRKETSIVMDTPYRLKKLLSEIENLKTHREIFVGCDLNKDSELLVRGDIIKIQKILGESKREFVMVIGAIK